MAAIGVFSDSDGDLELFDRALQLLAEKGATRFVFNGGKYSDLDDWAKWKREEAKSQQDYSGGDFLEDVSRYLAGQEQVDRPAAFGTYHELVRHAEELARKRDRILRTPERGSLQYQDPSVATKTMEMLGDALCCVVHDKNDLDKEDMLNAAVLIHGNAPEPAVVQIGPRYFISPGRLAGGKVSSVGLLEPADKGMKFSAFSLDGKTLIDSKPLAQGVKTKVTVK